MKKKILSIIMVAVLSIGVVGCGNTLANKSLETAKTFIENKEYDKALVSLEMTLDEDSENGEANKLYRIVEKYMEAKKLIDNNKFHEAEEVINKLNPSSYEGIAIEEDINKLKDDVNKHNEEEKAEKKKKQEAKKEQEKKENEEKNKNQSQVNKVDTVVNTENKVSNTEASQQKTEERQGICFVCKKKDNMSNLHEVHGRGVVHKSCYDSIPLCSICKEKLIYDSDGNGICDYKCDELCTNCWTNKANVKGGLCDKCEWNKYFENKATCSGCEGNGNIVDASLAGTKCPYCGEEFKVIETYK